MTEKKETGGGGEIVGRPIEISHCLDHPAGLLPIRITCFNSLRSLHSIYFVLNILNNYKPPVFIV